MILKKNGFTLLEFLLVMSLSIIFIGGTVKIFSQGQKLNLMHENIAKMQLEGLSTSILIENYINKAGTNFSEDNDYKIQPINWDKSHENSAYDKLAIVYENSGNDISCNGLSGKVIENVFEVKNESLYCNNIEIVENIKAFKVIIGLDLNEDNIPDRYVGINDSEILSKNDSNKIISIKFSILIKGIVEFGEKEYKNINILNSYFYEVEDKYNYRIFTRNLILKNML